jgi:hypothetical protein
MLGDIITLNAGVNATLPPIASVLPGQRISFIALVNTATSIISPNGTDTISCGQLNVTSLHARPGVITTLCRPFSSGSAWQIDGLAAAEFNGMSGLAGQPVGTNVNAACDLTAASATMTFTFDELVVATALNGIKYTLAPASMNLNLTTVGAGGMNAGTAPVNSSVDVWCLYNPQTGSRILLAGATTGSRPPMVCALSGIPTGYTASAHVGSYRTNASGNLLPFRQRGRKIWQGQQLAVINAGAPLAIQGFQWSVPVAAKTVDGLINITNVSAGATSVSLYSELAGTFFIDGANFNGIGGIQTCVKDIPLVTVLTSYFATSTTNSATVNVTLGSTAYTV